MTNRTPRILILTASYGDGHWQASWALEQAFHSQGIEDIRIMDLMEEAHPLLNGLSAWLYKKKPSVVQVRPRLLRLELLSHSGTEASRPAV